MEVPSVVIIIPKSFEIYLYGDKHLKKEKCCIQRIKKKISKEAKKQIKQRLKAIRNNQIDKNKEDLCVAGEVIQCRAYFRPFMHAIVACMKVPFSKLVKHFSIFCMFLCVFAHFRHYFAVFLKISNLCLHALVYERQCYYYLHILYNLVVLYYMHK